jgi:hypothetical protein
MNHLQLGMRPRGDQLGVVAQYREGAAAHGAQSANAYFHWIQVRFRILAQRISRYASGKPVILEHAFDAAYGLPGAMLVLDHAEAHVALAKFAKPNAWGDSYLSLSQ